MTRVRAYRFRAYTSKTTARVLETQLEVACKLYNTLLHAEQEEYDENKRTMSMNELRQLALDLRKKNPELNLYIRGLLIGSTKLGRGSLMDSRISPR